jgi:predicted esterase
MAFGQGFTLDVEGSRPEGMVRVPGGPYEPDGLPPVELEDYWLDRYEVTNRQFKEFVDTGGYEKEEYWTEPFVGEDLELSPEAAMAHFVDTTGRVGPAGWEFGAYDAGEADHPVGGVSWYEAAAYCRSVGKSLPTILHWYAATAQDQFSEIVFVSNFGDQGPAAVGSHPGLGDFGTYDMAGNVKEWCWNEGDAGRYVAGGAWGETRSMYKMDVFTERPPLSRELTHGFRCARYQAPPDEALLGSLIPFWSPRFKSTTGPVADEIFAAYRRMYSYDRSALEVTVDSIDENSPHWRKETVSFEAAYGNERLSAHLFLPRNAEPPYQPVVWFPGGDSFLMPAGDALASPYLFDFIPRSGRALVYPVYKGMYERHVPFSFATTNEFRDMMIMWSKDLSRTVDYLEGRQDIDSEKLGFYGFSLGASYGTVFTSVDERFKASILLGGGLLGEPSPEIDPTNFAPRSRVPTLMVNGRDDFLATYERSQLPLFRLLGAPEDEKRHARIEGGHIPTDRLELIKEVLSWLDRFLGPVEATAAGSN